MKKIFLKSLNLKNFKGIKDLSIDFNQETNIYGENGTGKSSVFDAFTWLLFDKDSTDRKDFEIKTLDANNNVLHGLEHSVEGIFDIDGRIIQLRKVYKEKWTKQRGEAEKKFTGNETKYYINDVPVKKNEYQDEIKNIIDENLFKLLSNPLFFSINTKWQDRRKILLEIIGDLSEETVIASNDKLKQLKDLLKDTEIDTLKKSVSAKRRNLNEDIKSIPFRIDECNNSISELDFKELEDSKNKIRNELDNVNKNIADDTRVSKAALDKKEKLYELKNKLLVIENNEKTKAYGPLNVLQEELSKRSNEMFDVQHKSNGIDLEINKAKTMTESLRDEIKELRVSYSNITKEYLELPHNLLECPTCKREFPPEEVENKKKLLEDNFNRERSKRLSDINSKGKLKKEKLIQYEEILGKLNEDKEKINNQLLESRKQVAEIKGKIEEFKPSLNLDSNSEYMSLKAEIEAIENELNSEDESTVMIELKNKKRELQNEIDEINSKLALKEHNEKMKNRIADLMEEEKNLAAQIAELEKHEYLCEEFIKTKVELLESSINAKFKYVKFKLFNDQINGGLNETCEALINGIPYSDANTASKFNAGLDIINALSSYYEIQAPIFIDNRESVNKIIETNNQVINLKVSTDKTLKVEVSNY